jgi:hypothetical protein
MSDLSIPIAGDLNMKHSSAAGGNRIAYDASTTRPKVARHKTIVIRRIIVDDDIWMRMLIVGSDFAAGCDVVDSNGTFCDA